jgi:hypothetical protein
VFDVGLLPNLPEVIVTISRNSVLKIFVELPELTRIESVGAALDEEVSSLILGFWCTAAQPDPLPS